MKRNLFNSIKRNKRGETLVEAIVAVAIFSIAMVTVTMMIRFATSLNNITVDMNRSLEAATTKAEMQTGTNTTGSSSPSMVFTVGGGSATCTEFIDTYSADGILIYFTPKP